MTSRVDANTAPEPMTPPRPPTPTTYSTAFKLEDGKMEQGSRTVTHVQSNRTATGTGASDYGSDIDIYSVQALSDYGSEIDPDDIDEDSALPDLLESIKRAAPVSKAAVIPSIEFEEGEREDENDEEHIGDLRQAVLHTPKSRVFQTSPASLDRRQTLSSPIRDQHRASIEVEYDFQSRRAWSVPREQQEYVAPSPSTPEFDQQSVAVPLAQSAPTPPRPDAAEDEKKTPLERFRTKPRKTLSVTDLVSPAWCELQYFYTLSKFGRKPRTQAMKRGSRIHQTLEDEVHQIIPVQVKSKEDRFGLRLWNTIQGLRTLRTSGMTRELEIWGVVDGQVVNGVIDEISYTCPDPDFEEQLELSRAKETGGTVPLPAGQKTIEQAFAKVSASYPDLSSQKDEQAAPWLGSSEPEQRVYVTDVKTRGVRSVPAAASLRPTWMQLMLYRKLLECLTLNIVDAETVLLRYDVKPLEPFTEVFLQEVGGMDSLNSSQSTGMENQGTQTAMENATADTEISLHPNLLSLWSLLITECQLAIPPNALSDILRAEFRWSKTGEVIGSELTVYDYSLLDKYIASEMQWWKGERPAQGVEVEEAFKCRICDFADDCVWRRNKVEEAVEKNRLRREKARGKSAV